MSSCFSGKSSGPQVQVRLPNRINHGVMESSCMDPVSCCEGSKCPVSWQTATASSLRKSCCACRNIVENTAAGSWSRLVADQSDWSLVIIFHVIWVVACIVACTDWSSHAFQVSGAGNCLYASIKKGLGVRLANEQDFPYYPMRYFRRQVANWLVNNRQRVMLHKEAYLRQTYGIPDADARFPTPFSYKQYCRNVLDRHFWGDAVMLYAVSCMWSLKLTVVNSQTLQQYRVRHAVGLKDVDVALVFNASCHYTAAGM